eukprot:5596406-Pyramimonas_sp.AAC.1
MARKSAAVCVRARVTRVRSRGSAYLCALGQGHLVPLLDPRDDRLLRGLIQPLSSDLDRRKERKSGKITGVWRGCGGCVEGICRSSVDAREPQNLTKSEEYRKHLQGV